MLDKFFVEFGTGLKEHKSERNTGCKPEGKSYC